MGEADAVARWAADRIDAGRIDAAARLEPALLREMGDVGLFGLAIPEPWGGSGLGLPAICDVVGALARHDRSIATTVGLHAGLGTRGLVVAGSPGQWERWLPDLASGRRIAAFAATEPGAGSDLSRVATRLSEDGEGLRLDGAKIFVTNGGIAGLYTVLVASPGLGARRGQTLVLVEREDGGVSVGPEERKLGLRGSSTTPLHLDRVRLAADRVIGGAGHGATLAAHVLAWGRTVMAAGCVGAASAALDAVVAQVTRRRQFGRPLGQLDVVRDQVAGLAALHFAMGALAARAAVDPERLSAAAKVLCSDGDWEICDVALQLHGGSGFVEDTGLPLLLRDARITRIFEGANDVLLTNLGLQEATRPAPALDRPLHAVVRDAREEALALHRTGLVRETRVLHRLGRLVVLRESCDAATDVAATEHERALAAHWTATALRRIPADPPDPTTAHAITETLYEEAAA